MKRNALIITLVILLAAAWALWPQVSLHYLKLKALDDLTEGGTHSFTAREIREMTFDAVEILNHLTVDFEQSVFDLPQPQTSEIEKTGAYLEYENFRVSIVDTVDGEVLKNLPAELGSDDLAKMVFLDRISDDLIRDAKTPEELKKAVALITAKMMMTSVASDGPTVQLQGDGYRGVLQGDFSENPKMVCHLKSDSGDLFLVLIVKTGEAIPEDVHQFLSEIRIHKKAE